MRTRLLLISFLLLSFSYRSVAFVVDELFYRVLSTEEGTVSCYGINRPYDETIGTLTIPAEVTYEGTTYQVTDIAKSAFSGLEIYDLTLPEGIVSIGVSAFQGCPISDVKIPASVQTIGKYAFGGKWDGCPDAEGYCWEYYPVTYTVNSGNSYFSSSCGILYNKDKTKLIDVPYGCSQDIYIPSSLEEIPNDAFFDRDRLSGKNLYITNLANFCKIIRFCPSIPRVSPI